MNERGGKAPVSEMERLWDELKKLGAKEFELYGESAEMLSAESKDGAVDGFQRSVARGLAVRVIDEGRLGFAYTTDFTPEAIARLAREAVASAKESSEDRFLGLAPPPGELPEVSGIFDPGLAQVPLEEKTRRAIALEEVAKGADPRIKRVRKAAYKEAIEEACLRTSRGIDLCRRTSTTSASITVVAEENGSSEMGWDYDFSHAWDGLDVATVGRRAAERALSRLGGRPMATCSCAAVLENHVAADLIDVLSNGLLAESVAKGKSMFAGKVGQKVASETIELIDDGLYPGGLATSPFDDEGNPRQRTALISGGVLQGFLYDQYSANKDGVRSTGNASRPSLLSPPLPQVSNFYLAPGKDSLAALLRKLDRGVLITDVLGMHTANPVSGDFSVGAAGSWVELGKISHPVKGIAISGNVLTLLSRVSALGSDLRFFGRIGAPSLLVTELNVGGV